MLMPSTESQVLTSPLVSSGTNWYHYSMARALTVEQREEWMVAMEARTAAAHARLVEGVTQLAGREGWQSWLDFAARLPHYSVSNQLLLAAQAPTASLVMSAAQWRLVGRYPARGSTALRIWAPRRATQHDHPGATSRPGEESDDRPARNSAVDRDADGRARFLLGSGLRRGPDRWGAAARAADPRAPAAGTGARRHVGRPRRLRHGCRLHSGLR